jgi:hypothetical protein
MILFHGIGNFAPRLLSAGHRVEHQEQLVRAGAICDDNYRSLLLSADFEAAVAAAIATSGYDTVGGLHRTAQVLDFHDNKGFMINKKKLQN